MAGALAFTLPQTALAGDSEDFAGCDGMKKPKRDEDGMRGMANQSDFGRMRINRERAPGRVIAYCTSVLEGDRIRDHQTLRRAHVLRARAAAYIQTGEAELALADLATAREQVADRGEDLFFQRSMGLSLDLLEAVALAQRGDVERAGQLATTAGEARPYSLQVQLVADRIAAFADLQDGPSQSLMQIMPRARQQTITRLVNSRRFAEAVERGEAAGLVAAPVNGDIPLAALLAGGDMETLLLARLGDIVQRADLAYALAATGDTDRAQALVTDLRAVQAPAEDAPSTQKLIATLLQSQPVDARIALAEARTAVALADSERARQIIADADFGDSPLIAELNEALAALTPDAPAQVNGEGIAEGATVGDEGAALAVVAEQASEEGSDGEPAKESPSLVMEAPRRDTRSLRNLAYPLLFPPETARSVIDYERSRPNILGALVGGVLSMGTSLLGGIDRTAGFRSTDNEDGTITVEFTGNTISGPMVQEMTLLRAAELASEAQHPYFEIVQREDYMRYMVQTQYGVEINRFPNGFKTELVIRFHDEPEASPFLLEAVGVIDNLGPLYYEEG